MSPDNTYACQQGFGPNNICEGWVNAWFQEIKPEDVENAEYLGNGPLNGKLSRQVCDPAAL